MIISTLLLQNDNKILLLQKFTHGLFVAPGGKNESNETPIQAAIREFREETGLLVENPELKAISNVKMPDKEFVMYSFYANHYTGQLTNVCPEGELNWVTTDQIDELDMPKGDKLIIKHALKENYILNMNVSYKEGYNLLDMEVIQNG